MPSAIEKAHAELSALRSERTKLIEAAKALEDLMVIQNGCPLLKHRDSEKEYAEIMKRGHAALAALPSGLLEDEG